MKYLLALPFFLGLALTPQQNNTRQQIDEIMGLQEKAWNIGSLEGFMNAYWKSDSLRFIGSKGISYGWHKALENYKRSYPSKKHMGKLKFKNLTYKPLGNKHFHINGKWTLFRDQDTLSGHYSLVWQKMNGTWKIINDHSS